MGSGFRSAGDDLSWVMLQRLHLLSSEHDANGMSRGGGHCKSCQRKPEMGRGQRAEGSGQRLVGPGPLLDL